MALCQYVAPSILKMSTGDKSASLSELFGGFESVPLHSNLLIIAFKLLGY